MNLIESYNMLCEKVENLKNNYIDLFCLIDKISDYDTLSKVVKRSNQILRNLKLVEQERDTLRTKISEFYNIEASENFSEYDNCIKLG